MENILTTIILSLVQGLTEFLPISSSGHLVLASYLFGLEDLGLGFSVALHVGTLLAVLAYFRKDWIEIFRLAFDAKAGTVYDMHPYIYTKKTLYYLVIATIPAALTGFFFSDLVGMAMRHPIGVSILILFGGFVLWLADVFGKHKRDVRSIRTRDAVLIGLAQVLALVPGISRSGMTITVGLFLGLSRKDAARFSFLMATPVIIGAAIIKLPDLISIGLGIEVMLGIILSFVSAYIAIRYMLLFIEKVRYQVFFWYSIVLVFITLAYTFSI